MSYVYGPIDKKPMNSLIITQNQHYAYQHEPEALNIELVISFLKALSEFF